MATYAEARSKAGKMLLEHLAPVIEKETAGLVNALIGAGAKEVESKLGANSKEVIDPLAKDLETKADAAATKLVDAGIKAAENPPAK